MTGALAMAAPGTASAATHKHKAHKAKSLLIGGVDADATDPYFITIQCGAEAEAKALGVRLHMEGTSQSSASAETAVLNSVEALHPAGVLLAPYSNSAFVAPVHRLMQSGVPVTTVDAPLVRKAQYQAIFTNNVAAGRALAAPLAKAIHGSGDVAVLTYGAGDLVQNARWKGLKQALKKYPKIHMLTPQYVSLNSSLAASTTTSLLARDPKIKAVFATEGPAGSGAASALLAAHKKGVVKLYSFDAEPVEVQGLKKGEYQGLVAQSPYLEGVDGMKSLVHYLRSGHHGVVRPTKPFHIKTPVKVLTRANVGLKSSKPFLYLSSCK